MPTNEQRRETAKRKLERQLERRAARARRQRQLTIAAAGIGVLLVIGAVVAAVFFLNKDSGTAMAAPTSSADSTAPSSSPAAPPSSSAAPDQPLPPSARPLPSFTAPAGLGDNCQYGAAATAAKKANPPRTGKVPTSPAQISASLSTNQGNIGLQLDNAKAPCTVNSFASLAQQGYFNDTPCHRLTASPSLSVLQCGDPKGDGSGGPGYQFANEYPTNQFGPNDPALRSPVVYPRGTLAMANAGPGTNGSQFFLVYKDSQLPPNYTAFGTIDQTGLATLDKIAAGGVDPATGAGDGKPKLPVQIKSIQLD